MRVCRSRSDARVARGVSFAFYLGTGRPHYKRWGFIILKWTVIAGVTFFAVLFFGRIV
jgi:hypothetical protein